ncbi:MAG: hypothetical protein ABL985_21380 [Casimicrobium sp.]
MTQEHQPQPDQTRAEQTNKIIMVLVGLAIIAGVWFNYESGKPPPGSPYASCYRFPGTMDTQCSADLAASALSGRGHVHSKEYLNGYK